MSADSVTTSIRELVAEREIIITCGSGGVGKTTTAAAIGAMVAATTDRKVLVLTVDPARRLATAMGLSEFGNVESQVPPELLDEARVDRGSASGDEDDAAGTAGELWAAMLDTHQSWNDLIRRHAPDQRTIDAILANPIYQSFTSTFVQSHDYIAMERLYELQESGDYDLIVVDTPPTRNAIDFLAAPERMADFFSSRLLRWLIAPYRSRVVNAASKPFLVAADRILGAQFLSDIADFFILFQSMYDGFVERAEAVSEVLADHRTSFVVVSTLEAAPSREARFFMSELKKRKLNLGALVLNKTLPPLLLERGALRDAEEVRKNPSDVASKVPQRVGSPKVVGHVLEEIADRYLDYRVLAKREAELRGELSGSVPMVASVPYLSDDVSDLGGLIEMATHLFGSSDPDQR